MVDAQLPLFAPAEVERAARLRWRELVDERMPAVARARGWPIGANHCFARVLLDGTLDRPWREVITPPAWRNAPVEVLIRATELGEAALAGVADLDRLNRRSLWLRTRRPRAQPA